MKYWTSEVWNSLKRYNYKTSYNTVNVSFWLYDGFLFVGFLLVFFGGGGCLFLQKVRSSKSSTSINGIPFFNMNSYIRLFKSTLNCQKIKINIRQISYTLNTCTCISVYSIYKSVSLKQRAFFFIFMFSFNKNLPFMHFWPIHFNLLTLFFRAG